MLDCRHTCYDMRHVLRTLEKRYPEAAAVTKAIYAQTIVAEVICSFSKNYTPRLSAAYAIALLLYSHVVLWRKPKAGLSMVSLWSLYGLSMGRPTEK